MYIYIYIYIYMAPSRPITSRPVPSRPVPFSVRFFDVLSASVRPRGRYKAILPEKLPDSNFRKRTLWNSKRTRGVVFRTRGRYKGSRIRPDSEKAPEPPSDPGHGVNPSGHGFGVGLSHLLYIISNFDRRGKARDRRGRGGRGRDGRGRGRDGDGAGRDGTGRDGTGRTGEDTAGPKSSQNLLCRVRQEKK